MVLTSQGCYGVEVIQVKHLAQSLLDSLYSLSIAVPVSLTFT